MSRHNRERRLFRKLQKAGQKLTPYQLTRIQKHGKKRLKSR